MSSAPPPSCPVCGGTLTTDPRYSPWCAACDWNVVPPADADRAPVQDRWYLRLDRRLGDRLFDDVVASGGRPARWSLTRLAAVLLAGVVLLGLAAVFVFAVVLAVATFPHLFALVGSSVLVLIVVLLRPRLGRLSGTAHVVSDAEAPVLHQVLGRIADHVGAPRPRLVVLDATFNAGAGIVGWRRRFVLVGLAWWSVTPWEERVFVLAHELAHHANGDVGRGRVVGAAMQSLVRWIRLCPAQRGQPVLLNVWFALISFPARVTAWLLALLLWRDSQRGEYVADARASRLSGRAVAAASLRRLYVLSTLEVAVQRRAARRDGGDVWEALAEASAQVPSTEIDRRQRAEERLRTAIDTTHPPVYRRLAAIEALAPPGPAFVLTESEQASIEAELRTPMAVLAVGFNRQ